MTLAILWGGSLLMALWIALDEYVLWKWPNR